MNTKDPFTITLALVALATSLYATYQVHAVKNNAGELDDQAFVASVNEIIDDYVAEKSGKPQEAAPAKPVDASIDDDAVKGDDDAPVTIIEFSDYECPFCGRYFRDTLGQITENYIDTGKVKYVFRDFPLSFHASAKPAANAAECIREQGGDDMYYDYHDILFQNQGALGVDELKEYAADFDIDQTEFATCLDEGRYDDEIDTDFKDGQAYGVRGTPAFFINGVLVSGAQPYTVFEAAIEDALK